jgi:hypothetical protein
MDDGYLGRNVNNRTYQTERVFRASIDSVMRKAAAAGMLGSGNTLWSFREEALRIFGEHFKEAAQFVYNLTESNEGESIDALAFYVKRVVGLFMQYIRDASLRLGMTEAMVAGEVTKIEISLEEQSAQLLDDFRNGMMGNVRMKKDPAVNVVLNQTNSPSAVQQVGFGHSSQTANTQHYQQLTVAIDAALKSHAFDALAQKDKEAFQDIAIILKEEASKPQPDDAKLKRWGERIVSLGQEIGLRVASAAILDILKGIFGT